MNSTATIILRHLIPALQAIQRDIQEAERTAPPREPPTRVEPPAKEVGTQPKKLFRFAEAAEFLCVSKRTLYRLVSEKQVPHYRIGNRYLFNEQQLLTWLDPFANGIEAPTSPRSARRN